MREPETTALRLKEVELRQTDNYRPIVVIKVDFDKGVHESTPVQFIYDQLEILRKHVAELHNRLQELEGK